MRSIGLKFGLLSGLVAGIGLVLPFMFMSSETPDFDKGEIIGYLSMVLASLVILPAVWKYRNELGGTLTFAQGLKLGCMVAAIAGLIFVVFDTFYLLVMNPDFFEQYISFTAEQMAAEGVSQEEIDATLAQYEQMKGPAGVVITEVFMFFNVFLFGFCASLISALVFKRKHHPNEPQLQA